MDLEVKVQETIHVTDTLVQAEQIILEAIRQWAYDPEQTIPLTITLTKIDGRAPPTLGVVVSETIKTREALA